MFLHAGNDDPTYPDIQKPDPKYDYLKLGEKVSIMQLPVGHHHRTSMMVFDCFLRIGALRGYNSVVNSFSVSIRPQQQTLYYECWYKIPYKRSVHFDEIKSVELREMYKGVRAERQGYPKKLFLYLHSGKRVFLGKSVHQQPGNAEKIAKEFAELIGKPFVYAA